MARSIRASCPTANHEHGDRSSGLLVSERESDGAVLVCCPAGCPADEIVGALGLAMHDLYPRGVDGDQHARKGTSRPFPAGEVLAALAHEACVAYVICCDVQRGVIPDAATRERLALSVARLQAGAQHAGGAYGR
jgi:hypothetical protein